MSLSGSDFQYCNNYIYSKFMQLSKHQTVDDLVSGQTSGQTESFYRFLFYRFQNLEGNFASAKWKMAP